ncbi:hypothetical protein C9J48_23995 [Photobacterium profundum]|uniref:Holin n=1 Tax=Photobacterium profundum 3TCK TaxID=314280 RepID=Q1Z9F6_9GAMM|nr:hypothetical protein [Photobacterium profundum]EAS44802.1 hypothetical protein P3TCK_20000 [Photobacterium profundum 3TCK]PSV59323.1 hypothetical protein C9J48_23995 [Photobacterium profundum]
MIDFKQRSTQTGLVLIASVAAGILTGNTELADVTIGESGVQMSGVIPAVAAMLIGLWDTFRKEKK